MSEHDVNIVTALDLVENKMKLRSKTTDVLKASDINYDPNKKQIVGGDSTDFEHDRHPAIIIEKNGEQMSKIIVRCPCGRHSELVCEYEDEVGTAVETQAAEDGTPDEASEDEVPSEDVTPENADAAEADQSEEPVG